MMKVPYIAAQQVAAVAGLWSISQWSRMMPGDFSIETAISIRPAM